MSDLTEQMTRNLKISDYGFTILMIETKRVCNMQCKFCAYPIIKNKGEELPTEMVHRIIDSLDPNDMGLESIYLQRYNEPLSDPRIYGFITYAKNRGFKTQIITNGLLLQNKEIRDKLFATEPTRILLSFQSLNKETFTKTRKMSSSFESYKEGIFTFLDEAQHRNTQSEITIDIACNFQSDKVFSKTGQIRKVLGLNCGDPSVPDTTGEIKNDLIQFVKELHDFNNAFAYDKDTIEDFLRTAHPDYTNQIGLSLSKNTTLKIKQFIYGRKLTRYYPSLDPVGCNTNMLSIDADGSVSPCCLAYNNLLVLGNVWRNPPIEILQSSRNILHKIRSGQEMPHVCKVCQGEPTQRGVLVASVYRNVRETGNNLIFALRNPVRRMVVHEQDLKPYSDTGFADGLETWGNGTAWFEIQTFFRDGMSGKVLDIACGTGKVMELLSRNEDLDIYGCDLSGYLIACAKSKVQGKKENLTVCDATRMTYPDKAFDHSYSIGSLEHFTNEGIKQCIAEISRVTKYSSFHMVPVSKSGRNEGWIRAEQSYHNNTERWWVDLFGASFNSVTAIDSAWEDRHSNGKWFICRNIVEEEKHAAIN